jgi:uncharacterized SAM-binding protein YcdF (DUF218 family)
MIPFSLSASSMMILKVGSRKQRHRRLNITLSKIRRLICLVPILIVLSWLGYKKIRSFETPQAVLMLGGSTSALEREKFTANFARQHPNLEIWISSGGPGDYPENYNNYVKRVFLKAGVRADHLHLDDQAVDTVTNFTTLVDELKSRGIRRVYLITSDYHMRRASTIGEIVLGSRGIDFQPISVPTNQTPESMKKAVRDGARAILWVTTGYTGATLNKPLKLSHRK